MAQDLFVCVCMWLLINKTRACLLGIIRSFDFCLQAFLHEFSTILYNSLGKWVTPWSLVSFSKRAFYDCREFDNSLTIDRPAAHFCGIFTRDRREHESDCQILVTVPQCLMLYLLSPTQERHRWQELIQYAIVDEVHCLGISDDQFHPFQVCQLGNPPELFRQIFCAGTVSNWGLIAGGISTWWPHSPRFRAFLKFPLVSHGFTTSLVSDTFQPHMWSKNPLGPGVYCQVAR